MPGTRPVHQTALPAEESDIRPADQRLSVAESVVRELVPCFGWCAMTTSSARLNCENRALINVLVFSYHWFYASRAQNESWKVRR
jgi:hypothetical protein